MGDDEKRSYRRACDVLGVQARQVVMTTLRGSTPSTLTLRDVSEADVTALLHILTGTKTISGLQLVRCRLNGATWKQLAHAVIGNESLVSLSFKSCDGVGKDGVVHTLPKKLQGSHRSSLRDVCLSDCGLGLAGLEALIDGLVCLPQLPHGTVDLSRNALPKQAGILLAKLTRSVNGPRTLNLSHNELGDCGAAAIGGGLAADLRKLGPDFGRLNLTHLNLSYNTIGDEGLAKLWMGVRAYMAREVVVVGEKAMARPMCPLKELLLAGNRITDDGASSCIAMLTSADEQGLWLRHLDVGYNRLADAGVAAVCGAVEQAGVHCSLETLDLRGVGLGTVGLKAVAAAITANGAMRHISVSLPPLEQDRDPQATLECLQQLADSIERSTSLTEVSLEGLSRYVEYAPSIVGSVLMRVEGALAINRARTHGDVEKLGSPPQTPKHTPQQTMPHTEDIASLAAPALSSAPLHASPSSSQPPLTPSPRTRPHNGSTATPRLASSSSPKRSSYTRPAPRRQPSLKRARSGGRAAGGGGDGGGSGGGASGMQGERERGKAGTTGGGGDGDAEADTQKAGLMVGKSRVASKGGEMQGEAEGAKRVGAQRPLPPALVIPEGDRLGLGVFRRSLAEAAVGGKERVSSDRSDGGKGNLEEPRQDGPLQQPEQAGPVSAGEAEGLVAVSTDLKETPGRADAPNQLEQGLQPPQSVAAETAQRGSDNPVSGCHGEPVKSVFTPPDGTALPAYAPINLIKAPFGAVVEAQEPQLQYTGQAVAANDHNFLREELVNTPESLETMPLTSRVASHVHAGGHSHLQGPQPELVPEVPTASTGDGSAGSTVHVSTHMGRCRSSPSMGGTAAGRASQAENMGGRSDRMNARSPGGGRNPDALLDVWKPSRVWEQCDQQQEFARSPRHGVLPNVNTGNVGALKASPGGVSRSRRLIVPTPSDSGISKTKVMAELREGLGGQSDDMEYVLVVSNSNSPRGAADPAELSDDEEVSRVLGQCQDEHDDQLDAEPVVESVEVDAPTIEVPDAASFEPRDDLASVSSSSLELSPSSASSTSSSLSLSSSQTPEMVAVAERRGTSRRISSVAVTAQVTGAREGWGPADVRSSLLVGGKGPQHREEKEDAPVSVELRRRLTQVQGQAAEAVVCVEEPSVSAFTRRDSQQHRRNSCAPVRGVSLNSPSLKSSAVNTLQAAIESEADAALQAFGAALGSKGAMAQRTRGSLSLKSPRRVSRCSVPEDRMPQSRSTPPTRSAQGAEPARSRLSCDITTYPFEAIQADTADPSPSTTRNLSSRVHHHHPADYSAAKLRSQEMESRDVVRKGKHQERKHEPQHVHPQRALDTHEPMEGRSGGRGRGVGPRVRPGRETDLLENGADGRRRRKKWREIEAVLQRIMQLGPVLSDTRYETLLHRVNTFDEMLLAMTTAQTQRACKERSQLKKVRRRVMELESKASALMPHGRTNVRRQLHGKVSAGTDAQQSTVDSSIQYQVPPLESRLLAQEQDTVMVLERIMTLVDSLRDSHEGDGNVRAEVRGRGVGREE